MMDAHQAEVRSILCTFRSELKETIQRVMRAAIQSVRSELDGTTPCQEATETKPDPGLMQTIEGHQERPEEEAAVMPVREPRKRCMVCNLSAERCQKRKERIRGKSGSMREPVPPAGGCPAVQKWHGVKETSSRKFGP
jgi:hypothetical protein